MAFNNREFSSAPLVGLEASDWVVGGGGGCRLSILAFFGRVNLLYFPPNNKVQNVKENISTTKEHISNNKTVKQLQTKIPLSTVHPPSPHTGPVLGLPSPFCLPSLPLPPPFCRPAYWFLCPPSQNAWFRPGLSRDGPPTAELPCQLR